MVTFTITQWQCDRCGTVKDEAPERIYPRYSLVANGELEVAAGRSLCWKDMCHDCNRFVGDLIKELHRKASQ